MNNLVSLELSIIYGMIIYGSLKCITSRNSLYSVLYLILVFILSGVIIYNNTYPFLGIVFVIIYAGALAILFIFAIMSS